LVPEGASTEIDSTPGVDGTNGEWVVSAPIALTGQGACVPVDMAADEAGRVYVAVNCQDLPAPIGSAPASGPVVFATMPQTRIAAAAPGVAYTIMGDLHGDAARTIDGGQTWTGLGRPNHSDHWFYTTVVAVGTRAIFGGVNIGPLGQGLTPPLRLDIWQPPATVDSGTTPSSQSIDGNNYALRLGPGASQVWCAAVVAGALVLERSEDNGATFTTVRSANLGAAIRALTFGGDRLFVLDQTDGVTIVPLDASGSETVVSGPHGLAEQLQTAVAGDAVTLTVLTLAAGELSAARLDPGASTFSAPIVLGAFEAPAVAAVLPGTGGIGFSASRAGAVLYGSFRRTPSSTP
jgi:hypothetical protein